MPKWLFVLLSSQMPFVFQRKSSRWQFQLFSFIPQCAPTSMALRCRTDGAGNPRLNKEMMGHFELVPSWLRFARGEKVVAKENRRRSIADAPVTNWQQWCNYDGVGNFGYRDDGHFLLLLRRYGTCSPDCLYDPGIRALWLHLFLQVDFLWK